MVNIYSLKRFSKDEHGDINVAIKWKRAYYPLEDKRVNVSYALNKRKQNGNEYRENPCYNSKQDYDEGLGIKLTPVDNSTNNKTDHFRAYGNGENGVYNDNIYSKLRNEIGLGNTSNALYRNTAIRVKTMINFLASTIINDKIASKQMDIEKVKPLSSKKLNMADVEIIHKGDFHRRKTRIFVIDKGRKPTYVERDSKRESISNWFLDITKWAPDIITDWDKARPLLMKDWKGFDNRTRRELKINEQEAQERKLDFETNIERENRDEKEQATMKAQLKEDEVQRIRDKGRVRDSKLHKRAREIIREWRGFNRNPARKNLTYPKFWNGKSNFLSRDDIEKIDRLDALTEEPDFAAWADGSVPWGVRTSHGRADFKFVEKKIMEPKEYFYELVNEVSELVDKVSSKMKEERKFNLFEIGIGETNIEREDREYKEIQSNFDETGFNETNRHRDKRESYISSCNLKINEEYNVWLDRKNHLDTIKSLLSDSQDLNKIPQKRHNELRTLFTKASHYVGEQIRTFQDIIERDQLTRVIVEGVPIWENDSHEKVSEFFHNTLENLTGSTAVIESLSLFFPPGKIKKKFDDNGVIELSGRDDLPFHKNCLRGLSFSDLNEGQNVLLVVDSKDSPRPYIHLVFSTMI